MGVLVWYILPSVLLLTPSRIASQANMYGMHNQIEFPKLQPN